MSALRERWLALRSRIDAACGMAGRDPHGVTIVAVSKMFGPEAVREAYEAGARVFRGSALPRDAPAGRQSLQPGFLPTRWEERGAATELRRQASSNVRGQVLQIIAR